MIYHPLYTTGQRLVCASLRIKMPIRMFNDAALNPIPSQQVESRQSSNYATRTIGANFIPRPKQPEKQILWIGCSDSDCKETTILDFLPDEMLEHRNLGNMIIDGDLSCETSVKHAVVDLRVKHIVVCGHYGCGIVKATSRNGLPGPWLR